MLKFIVACSNFFSITEKEPTPGSAAAGVRNVYAVKKDHAGGPRPLQSPHKGQDSRILHCGTVELVTKC
jgi:hypothetical protein